ncbi:hypothetical protein D9Q98_003621 [Chlorella vulgaris]|uniref:EF-hand domain-containing protein n=1 Tax=Chlorella vulgaris TaxID=3077 RepID=A0A9D4YYP6_CHLVU|nr:hypothetical protein D9Q98_003621 [Chlorella vulgaris]
MSGFVDRLRKLSGRLSEDTNTSPTAGVSSPKANPWRGVFDPNSNPNMKAGGRSHYDTPDPANPKTTWDFHLDAEKAASGDMTAAAPKATAGRNESDVMDAESLRKMFTPDRMDRIMQAADKNKDGKISFSEFMNLARSHDSRP